MGRFRHHLFLCHNGRPEGGKPSCAPRGAAALYEAFHEAISARPELWSEVALSTSSCLGPCFDGPNLVVYPEGVWYAGLGTEDAETIVAEHLVAGRPVERLIYRWPDDDLDD